LAGRALIDLLGAAMLKPGISLEQAKAEL